MKNLFLLFTLIANFGICLAQNIAFADVNFKNHLTQRTCVDIDLNGSFDEDADTNNDNEISQEEAKNVKSLLLNSFNITDISEIKYFINLERLYGISLVPIAKPFDLKSNGKLEIIELAVDINRLMLSNFVKLTACKLVFGDKVSNVYINNNQVLKDIELNSKSFAAIKNIDTIDMSNNALESVNMKFAWIKNSRKVFYCQNNQLKTIKFSVPQEFDELDISNNLLNDQSITGSALIASNLYLQQNLFTNISITNYSIPMSKIEFWGNKLVSFKLSNQVGNSNIESFDFSGQSMIEKIEVDFQGNINQVKMDVLARLKEFNLLAKEIKEDIVFNETKALEAMNVKAKCNIYFKNLGRFLSPNFRITTAKDIHITDSSLAELKILSNLDYNKLYIENFTNLKSIRIEPNNDEYTDKIIVQSNPILESFYYKNSKKLDLTMDNCERLLSLKVDLADTLAFSYNKLKALQSLYLRSIFSTIDVSNIPTLKNATCSISNKSNLKIAHLDNLDSLTLLGICTGTLNLVDLPKIKYLAFNNITGGLGCNNINNIGDIIIDNFPTLKELKLNNLCVGDLQLSNLPLIENLKFDFLNLAPNKNKISVLNLSTLKKIELNNIKFESSIFQNLPSLETIISKSSTFDNSITMANFSNLKTINFDLVVADTVAASNLPSLINLSINRTYANNVVFEDLPILKKVFCNLDGYFNIIKKSKFSKLPQVKSIDFLTRGFNIDTVDLSTCPLLDTLNLDFSGSLNFLNLKNGNENFSKLSPRGFSDTYKTICVDSDIEKEKIKIIINPTSNTIFETDCIITSNNVDLGGHSFYSNDVNIYPNPTNGILTIEGNAFEKIEVYNALGDKMDFTTIDKSQLDVSTMKAGLYLLKLYDRNKASGEKQYIAKKFIKL